MRTDFQTFARNASPLMKAWALLITLALVGLCFWSWSQDELAERTIRVVVPQGATSTTLTHYIFPCVFDQMWASVPELDVGTTASLILRHQPFSDTSTTLLKPRNWQDIQFDEDDLGESVALRNNPDKSIFLSNGAIMLTFAFGEPQPTTKTLVLKALGRK